MLLDLIFFFLATIGNNSNNNNRGKILLGIQKNPEQTDHKDGQSQESLAYL